MSLSPHRYLFSAGERLIYVGRWRDACEVEFVGQYDESIAPMMIVRLPDGGTGVYWASDLRHKAPVARCECHACVHTGGNRT